MSHRKVWEAFSGVESSYSKATESIPQDLNTVGLTHSSGGAIASTTTTFSGAWSTCMSQDPLDLGLRYVPPPPDSLSVRQSVSLSS